MTAAQINCEGCVTFVGKQTKTKIQMTSANDSKWRDRCCTWLSGTQCYSSGLQCKCKLPWGWFCIVLKGNTTKIAKHLCERTHELFCICLCYFRMENLEKMFETGLYINDLSMHDSSRDLVLAGTQQQAELKMALDQVKHSIAARA